LDYLDRYPGSINALTCDHIQDAVDRFFSTEHLVLVMAGPGGTA
jgi:hypothetical protein